MLQKPSGPEDSQDINVTSISNDSKRSVRYMLVRLLGNESLQRFGDRLPPARERGNIDRGEETWLLSSCWLEQWGSHEGGKEGGEEGMMGVFNHLLLLITGEHKRKEI